MYLFTFVAKCIVNEISVA